MVTQEEKARRNVQEVDDEINQNGTPAQATTLAGSTPLDLDSQETGVVRPFGLRAPPPGLA